MYYSEFHVHQQSDNHYDLDEADAIIFSKETEHMQDAKSLEDLWDVIEAHPELDDLSLMVEVFIKEISEEEDTNSGDIQTLDDIPAIEGDEPLVDSDDDDESNTDNESVDECDPAPEWLEDWKIVVFADVLRISGTQAAGNPDACSIYREGSTLAVKAYEEGELPNIDGMISQLEAEDRMCVIDENGNIVLPGTIVGTVGGDEDSNNEDNSDDSSDDDDDDNGDTSDNTGAVEGDGDLKIEP